MLPGQKAIRNFEETKLDDGSVLSRDRVTPCGIKENRVTRQAQPGSGREWLRNSTLKIQVKSRKGQLQDPWQCGWTVHTLWAWCASVKQRTRLLVTGHLSNP